MKRKMKVIFSILMCFTILFSLLAVDVQAATTITTNQTGDHEGYYFSFWNQGGGSVTMTLGTGGNYSVNWSNCSNFTCGKGWRTGSARDVSYSGSFNGGNNGYLALYGWTKNALIEYYVIENYGAWTPPGGTSLGTMTSDGGTYNIYKMQRVNQPSIIGTATFDQYFSVRTTKRSSGTITFSNHINAWKGKGLNLGSTWDYQIMESEGYQSSGSANITVGATQPSTPPSAVPTNTPTKAPTKAPTNTPYKAPTNPPVGAPEDLNKDGAINMTDIMRVAERFNSIRGDSIYVAEYDLNNDGAINMTDIMIIAVKFNTLVQIVSNPPVSPTKAPPTATKVPAPTATIKPGKVVALTFDDGPSSQTTLVLDKLKKYNAKATFMVIGNKISGQDAVMKRIVSEGHEIGNHSWSHQSMNSMSASQITTEINQCNSAIQQYTGSTPKFFRAPNLSYSQTLFSTVRLAFVQGVIAQDWNGGSATTAQARAQLVINGVRDGSIVLMHCTQPPPHPTPEALDIIIPTLQQQGYSFVTLSELFSAKGKTPQLGVQLDGAF